MDMMIVLANTLRAVSLDDFNDSLAGKEVSSDNAEALSLVNMARAMSMGGS